MSKLKCCECDYETAEHVELANHSAEIHGLLFQSPYSLPLKTDDDVETKNDPEIVTVNDDDDTAGLKVKKPLECSSCPYSTTRRVDLRRHVRAVHLKIKNQRCSQCDYATSHAANLRGHMKKWHKKQEPLDVNSPTDGGNLKTHLSTEHVERKQQTTVPQVANIFKEVLPFMCGLCGYRTSSNGVLNDHVIDTHGLMQDCGSDAGSTGINALTSSLNLVCSLCGFETRSRDNLRNHISRHHVLNQGKVTPTAQKREISKTKTPFLVKHKKTK